MKLNGAVLVKASQEEVWKLFMDPQKLARVVPGCEEVNQLDATHYETILSIKVSFMTIRSKTQGTLLEIKEPDHLTVELLGQPLAMAGAFRALLSLNLAQAETGTIISYEMQLTMLGRLASLGEAIIRSTSERLSAQFSENVAQLFQPPIKQ